MSNRFSVAFNPPQPDDESPHDLLARLYHEIALSAVAAALEAFTTEQLKESIARSKEREIPAVLLGESLAA